MPRTQLHTVWPTWQTATARGGFLWVNVHDLSCLEALAAPFGIHEAVVASFGDMSCQSSAMETDRGVLVSICFFQHRGQASTGGLEGEADALSEPLRSGSQHGAGQGRELCCMSKLFIFVFDGLLLTHEVVFTDSTSTAVSNIDSLSSSPFARTTTSRERRWAADRDAVRDMDDVGGGVVGGRGIQMQQVQRSGAALGLVSHNVDSFSTRSDGAVADVISRICRHLPPSNPHPNQQIAVDCQWQWQGQWQGQGQWQWSDRYPRHGPGLVVCELFEAALRLQWPLLTHCYRGIAYHKRQLDELSETKSSVDAMMHLKIRALESGLVMMERQVSGQCSALV